MRTVFVSYSRKDRALVEELRAHLSPLEVSGGVDVWLDDEVEGGDAWESRIRERLEGAALMVACVTPRYLASTWCRREAELARARGVRILPVHLSAFAAASDLFADLQYVPDLSRPVVDWGGAPHDRDPAWARVAATVHRLLAAPTAAVDGPSWVAVSSGEFAMGSPDGFGAPSEWRARRVVISRPYWIGAAPVTQALWREVVAAARGVDAGAASLPGAPSRFQGDDQRPVEQVAWFEAALWCNALSALNGWRAAYGWRDGKLWLDPSADGARLPTEAEWEAACRAGGPGAWWWGDDPAGLPLAGWTAQTAGGTTHAVGRLSANPWGLHDVYGNVAEWCHDWFGPYAEAGDLDPWGAPAGTAAVVRGGSFARSAAQCRSAERGFADPGSRSAEVGFRVARWPG